MCSPGLQFFARSSRCSHAGRPCLCQALLACKSKAKQPKPNQTKPNQTKPNSLLFASPPPPRLHIYAYPRRDQHTTHKFCLVCLHSLRRKETSRRRIYRARQYATATTTTPMAPTMQALLIPSAILPHILAILLGHPASIVIPASIIFPASVVVSAIGPGWRLRVAFHTGVPGTARANG